MYRIKEKKEKRRKKKKYLGLKHECKIKGGWRKLRAAKRASCVRGMVEIV
jgi:hypothetical protein